MLKRHTCAAILLALTFVLPACAPRKENTTPHLTAQVKHVRQAQPLEQRYGIIVVEPVAITVDMARQYPQAARSCQSSAIRTLQEKSAFDLVHHTAPAKKNSPVLLVRSKITDMRLNAPNSSLKGKPPAGSSYINLDARLIDGATKKVLREKQLTVTSSFLAASNDAGRKNALAEALGENLAEYIYLVMPGQ